MKSKGLPVNILEPSLVLYQSCAELCDLFSDDLYRLRFLDETVRRVCFHQEIPTWESHREWVAHQPPATFLFILDVVRVVFAGFIRATRQKHPASYEIHMALTAEYRNRSIGKFVLAEFCRYMKTLGAKRLMAVHNVKACHTAPRLWEENGFVRQQHPDNDICVLVRSL